MRALLVTTCFAMTACSAAVQGGLPPLVTGCQTTADCSIAGPQFQCVQGGCMTLGCNCDIDCADAGLRCYSAGPNNDLLPGANQCLATTLGTPCGDRGNGGGDAGDGG